MSEAATFVAADEPGALEIVGSNPTDPTMIPGYIQGRNFVTHTVNRAIVGTKA